MRCVVAIILLFTLLMLLPILVLIVLMPSLPEKVTNDQLCVTHSVDQDLLCGHQRDVLTEFLNEELDASYKRIDKESKELHSTNGRISLKYYVKNQYWESKPAARFTGEPDLDIREGDNQLDMMPIRNWKDNRHLLDRGGFKRYGVHLTNGRIVVPVSGAYFIYSHLDLLHPFDDYFSDNDARKFIPKNGTIKHSMYKYSYHANKEIELFTSLTSPTKASNGRFNTYHSYLSGVVELVAGEDIYMKISDVHLLRHPQNNYIGVNLI